MKSIRHNVDSRYPPWGAAMWKAYFIERSGKDETNSLLANTVADLWLKVDFPFDDLRRAPGEKLHGLVPVSRCEEHVADLFVELSGFQGSVTSTLSVHKAFHQELSKEIQQMSHVTKGNFCKVAKVIKSVANGQLKDERDLESFQLGLGSSTAAEPNKSWILLMENNVSLEGSTWDAILLLGMRLGFSRFSHLGVALACVACVATQLILCTIFITLNTEQWQKRFSRPLRRELRRRQATARLV